MSRFAALTLLAMIAAGIHVPPTVAQPDTIVKPAVAPSGLVVPRFVSLGVTRGNMRKGPSTDHPIEWEYQVRGTPLEVLEEYQSWRFVRDRDGAEGWMHKQLLSGRRTAIVMGDWASIREEPLPDARIVARAEAGVLVQLLSCGAVWCDVDADGTTGWVDRDSLWGLYDHEILD